MRYLLIYTHPNPRSFNAAIRQAIERRLQSEKHELVVRDLYALKFNSLLSGDDFASFQKGNVPPDILAEQEHIKKADILVFVHPIWWFGMPGILKGYVDRVFSYGFAYTMTDNGPKGLLTEKKVIILNTTGGLEKDYQQFGFNAALKTTMEAGIFEFCGMTVLRHKYFYAVPAISDEARKKMLKEMETLPLV